MAQPITLQVFKGDQLLSTQPFDRDIIKIGRLQSAHLRLEDLKVARIHAVIELTNGGRDVSIIDMGSSEGTFLNGEKVQKGKLKDKDQVVVGDTKLIVHFGTPAQIGAAMAATAPPPSASVPAQVTAIAVAQGAQAQQRTAAAQQQAQRATGTGGAAAVSFSSGVTAAQLRAQSATPQYSVAPTFDRGAQDYSTQVERIGQSQLNRAAIGDAQGGGLEPEAPVSAENRALEMRMYWGDVILDINHLVKPKKITIGETKNTDIFITSEGLPREEFPLIRYLDDQYVLTFFNDLEGEIEMGGQLRPLREMRTANGVTKDDDIDSCYRLNLTPDSRAIVHWGGLTLAMRFVAPPQKIKAAALDLDFQFLNILLLAFFVMAISIISFSLYPYDTEQLGEDLFKSDNRFAQFILEPPKPPEQQKAAEDFLKKLEEKQAQGPAKSKGDEGKFGKKDTPTKDAHSAVKAIKPDDKEVIKNAGIFKFLGGSSGFSQVMGATPGLGGEVQNAIGNLTGKSAGDSGGLGGLGLRGSGPGGGGIGESMGLAKGIGTSGRMGGKAGYGSDKGSIGNKTDTDINIAEASPVVQGSLDPALIKKVIQENRNAIRYCYERELQVKKDLSGTIRTQFIISAEGTVTTSMVKDSTMKNPNVENCITGKIRGFIFPKPKGGGIVIVNYPFAFKSAN